MKFFWKTKKQKNEVIDSSNYDKDKFYNLDEQFVINIICHKIKNANSELNADQLTNDVISFLSKFLNRKLDSIEENAKIKNFIDGYIQNIGKVEKSRNVGLFQISLDDFNKININQEMSSKDETCDQLQNLEQNNENIERQRYG